MIEEINQPFLLKLEKELMKIRYEDIEQFWLRSRERVWNSNYTVWISPNGCLKAYTNDLMRRIALIWDRYTGQVLHLDPIALFELIRTLGGWI